MTTRPASSHLASDLASDPVSDSLPVDPFRLEALPLPRPADGYAVQFLGRDHLLDRKSMTFLPIRDPALSALFPDFSAALDAALSWQKQQGFSLEELLFAIVPAAFDQVFSRHILIYGVLPKELDEETTAFLQNNEF
ncbi:MAG: hypothetical protein FWG81_09135 [Betaproteobacteria bacterium]|nr:hypothetical protein [Betaproteobacteria bacterium]